MEDVVLAALLEEPGDEHLAGIVRGTEPAASTTLVPVIVVVPPSASCTVTVRFGPSEPVPLKIVIFLDFMKPVRLLTMPSTIFCLRA